MAVYELDSMKGIPSNLKEFLAKFDVVEKFEERNYTQISVKQLVYSRITYRNGILLSRGYFPLNLLLQPSPVALHFLIADPGGAWWLSSNNISTTRWTCPKCVDQAFFFIHSGHSGQTCPSSGQAPKTAEISLDRWLWLRCR